MDFLMNLHVVMTVVALGLVLLARPTYHFRSVMQDALKLAHEPAVKEMLDTNIHRKNVVKTQEEYMFFNGVMIPCFHVGLLCLGILWFALTYSFASTGMIAVSAGIIAAVATLLLTREYTPDWLMDWTVAMAACMNKAEADKIAAQVKVITERLQELINKAESGVELTDEEQIEVFHAIIRVKACEQRLLHIDKSTAAINEYNDVRRNLLDKVD
jgi:hypothetical protein